MRDTAMTDDLRRLSAGRLDRDPADGVAAKRERLGSALREMAADLARERRRTAELQRENRRLRQLLERRGVTVA
jgi:hypothetical protein